MVRGNVPELRRAKTHRDVPPKAGNTGFAMPFFAAGSNGFSSVKE
jgi:hypothetical protein